jgi:hypothetical protein
MTTSLSDVLEALRAALAAFTDAEVTLGAPVDSDPGLYLLAYNFVEDANVRNAAASRGQGYVLHCLLLPQPANDYALLDEGRRCLRERPVWALGESHIRVAPSSLPTEALSRIFDSAGVRLRLAIPFELRWSVSG